MTAVDAAGNAGASAPVALADRTPAGRRRRPADETVTPRTTSEAVLLRGGGSASARLLGQLALVGDAEPDDRRPAPAGARQGHVPVRLQGHDRQEVQDRHQDRRPQQAGYSHADQRQGRRGRPRQGRADGQAQVRQALGRARAGSAQLSSSSTRVDVPRSLATIVSSEHKGASCPLRPGSSSSPTRPPRRPRCSRRYASVRPAARRRSRCWCPTPRTACTSSSTPRISRRTRPSRRSSSRCRCSSPPRARPSTA